MRIFITSRIPLQEMLKTFKRKENETKWKFQTIQQNEQHKKWFSSNGIHINVKKFFYLKKSLKDYWPFK